MAESPAPPQSGIVELLQSLEQVIQRLEVRLEVHDTKHIYIEREITRLMDGLEEHTLRLSTLERLAEQNGRDIDRLSSTLSRLVWIIVSPLIATLIIALITMAGKP